MVCGRSWSSCAIGTTSAVPFTSEFAHYALVVRAHVPIFAADALLEWTEGQDMSQSGPCATVWPFPEESTLSAEQNRNPGEKSVILTDEELTKPQGGGTLAPYQQLLGHAELHLDQTQQQDAIDEQAERFARMGI